jgi:putative DNA primase/helicase
MTEAIREYLQSLLWDGICLLVDYLGAEDSAYVRAVTRKALAAAVARVFIPGIKFDYMLVMVGKQGLGKSHIISLLGQSWYSDSLNTVQGKEAYEQLQDAWLIEMAELSATRKVEAEAVKHFISKREDIYRVAYGKRVTKFPRQCVFFGTTNDSEFLRDKTGNRRFLPLVVERCQRKKNLWEHMVQAEIDQIWAEALQIFKSGEILYLEADMEKEAVKKQEQHTEESSKEGMIREYLDMLIPENWARLDVGARRRFINGSEFGETQEETAHRDKVCAMEVWVELFQGEPKLMTQAQAREINDILRKIDGWEVHSNANGKLRFGQLYGLQRAYVRKNLMET